MPLDRSSPVFFVKVGNAGSQSADRLPVDIRVVSLAFDEEEAKQDVLTLTIDNHDLANFDNPLFAIGNVVEAQWGYPGAMGKVREMTVTKVSGFLQLKVECKGKSHTANLVPRTRVFRNMRRSDIARQIAQERGLSDVATIVDTPVTFDDILQCRQTDAAFLRELAHKEGFDYYEDVNGFHFHPRQVGAPAVRRFTYFIDGVGDVESVNVEGDITAKPAVIVAAGRDPLLKENFAPYSNDQNSPGRPTNAATALGTTPKIDVTVAGNTGAITQPVDTDAPAHRVLSTAINSDDAKAQASAAFNRAQQKAVKVTLHCVGDALIEAKQVVELHGFGKVLDGNYHVSSSKQIVGPGFKMTLKLSRDGAGSQTGMAAASPDTDGNTNTTKGPNQTDQTPVATPDPKTGAINFVVGGQPKP